MDIWEHDLKDIGSIVVGEAFELFQSVGSESDFCIQNVGDNVVVFGGTNRLIWRFNKGFFIDKPYCTPRFIKRMEALLKGESNDASGNGS